MQEDVHADLAVRNQIKKIAKAISTFLHAVAENPDLLLGKGKLSSRSLRLGPEDSVTFYMLVLDIEKITSLPRPLMVVFTPRTKEALGRYAENTLFLHILNESQSLYPSMMYATLGISFDSFYEVFQHEMTHYFDEARLKGDRETIKAASAIDDGDQSDPEKKKALLQKYYNSPMEFNAHYQAIMGEVDKKVRRIPRKYRKEMFPTFEKFYTAVSKGISVEAIFFFDHLNPKMEKHVRKRLYQYYQLRIGGEDMEEKAVTANDELFFLDSEETKQPQVSFEEDRQILMNPIFLNGHLIEEGTLFRITS